MRFGSPMPSSSLARLTVRLIPSTAMKPLGNMYFSHRLSTCRKQMLQVCWSWPKLAACHRSNIVAAHLESDAFVVVCVLYIGHPCGSVYMARHIVTPNLITHFSRPEQRLGFRFQGTRTRIGSQHAGARTPLTSQNWPRSLLLAALSLLREGSLQWHQMSPRHLWLLWPGIQARLS